MFRALYKLHQALTIVLPKYLGCFSTVLTLLLLVDVLLRGHNPSNASEGGGGTVQKTQEAELHGS